MATFKRFEDIIGWQKASMLYILLLKYIQETSLKQDYDLRNQMDRSCGSIMDNIAEGFGRMGNGEFAHFLTISNGSARELQSQLYRSLYKKHFSQLVFDELYKLCEEVCKILTSLIFQIKQSEIKGLKFKKV